MVWVVGKEYKRTSVNSQNYCGHTRPVRLSIPLTRCSPMGIEPIVSDFVDEHLAEQNANELVLAGFKTANISLYRFIKEILLQAQQQKHSKTLMEMML
ncbi:hypothetical protein ACTXT7_009544 [Hymenolepis weldensis]